jgi:hypothetical protein
VSHTLQAVLVVQVVEMVMEQQELQIEEMVPKVVVPQQVVLLQVDQVLLL